MGYIGAQPATNFETVRKQVSTTNSGTTITLDFAVSSVQDILVTVNAVVQSYDNYSVSGTTLTLGGTLNNDRVEILYVGRTFQTVTPAIGTVTNDMLSGSIANSKLANSSITLNGSAVSLGSSATVGEANTPSWYAYQTSTQSLANNTTTLFSPTSIVKNTDSVYDSSNGRFTVPSGGDGFYFVYGHFRINNYDPNRCSAVFFVNGSEQNWSLHEHAPEGGLTSRRPVIHATAMMNLSATDYVEFKGHQGSGSTDTVLNIVFGGFKITT